MSREARARTDGRDQGSISITMKNPNINDGIQQWPSPDD